MKLHKASCCHISNSHLLVTCILCWDRHSPYICLEDPVSYRNLTPWKPDPRVTFLYRILTRIENCHPHPHPPTPNTLTNDILQFQSCYDLEIYFQITWFGFLVYISWRFQLKMMKLWWHHSALCCMNYIMLGPKFIEFPIRLYIKTMIKLYQLIVAQRCHMATQISVNIGSGNGLLPDNTKPLP